ncbi:hypothetical protein BJ508DRAFT_93478 [Ascobolus immersus RN42]|uniref:Uncharacterized protein n=1 Tax=Ascobolus immersus RN42 TaxID=1160509 RepID=A0A3N4IC56_ASCIM|nr:hypothetical protein BJ508DRAFT_93478 [Ascobolus immersus RN42]
MMASTSAAPAPRAPERPSTAYLSVPTFREHDPNDDIEVMSVLSFHREHHSDRPSTSSSLSSYVSDGDSSEEGDSRDHHQPPSAEMMKVFNPTTGELLSQIQRPSFATRPTNFPKSFADQSEIENAYMDLEGTIWALRGSLKLIAGNLTYVAFQAQQRADHHRLRLEKEHKLSTIVTILTEAQWEDTGSEVGEEDDVPELVHETASEATDAPVIWDEAVQPKEFEFPDEIFHVFATMQFMSRKITNLDWPEFKQFPEYDLSLEVDFFQKTQYWQHNLLWACLKNVESTMRRAVEYFGSYDPEVDLDAERLVALHNQMAFDIKIFQTLSNCTNDAAHKHIQRKVFEHLDADLFEILQK